MIEPLKCIIQPVAMTKVEIEKQRQSIMKAISGHSAFNDIRSEKNHQNCQLECMHQTAHSFPLSEVFLIRLPLHFCFEFDHLTLYKAKTLKSN